MKNLKDIKIKSRLLRGITATTIMVTIPIWIPFALLFLVWDNLNDMLRPEDK